MPILAIHGYAQAGVIIKSKSGSVRKGFKKKIELIFLCAPREVSE